MNSASWERIPLGWLSFPLPSYPEIKLEFFAYRRLARVMSDFQPDLIYIATEGPLGWAARRLCLRRELPFTTAYHTRFPEYLAARTPRFLGKFARMAAFAALRHFHAPSSAVMVATASIERELKAQKFQRLVRWSRGVDATLFRSYGKALPAFAHLRRPILLMWPGVGGEKSARVSRYFRAWKRSRGRGRADLAVLKRELSDREFSDIVGQELLRGALVRQAPTCRVPLHDPTHSGLVLLEPVRRPACRRHATGGALGHISRTGTCRKILSSWDPDLGAVRPAALRFAQMCECVDVPRAFVSRFAWGGLGAIINP